MMARMLSLFAAVAMFGAVSAANAAEPITLTDNQLDAVSAGYDVGIIIAAFVTDLPNVNTTVAFTAPAGTYTVKTTSP